MKMTTHLNGGIPVLQPHGKIIRGIAIPRATRLRGLRCCRAVLSDRLRACP